MDVDEACGVDIDAVICDKEGGYIYIAAGSLCGYGFYWKETERKERAIQSGHVSDYPQIFAVIPSA